MEGALGHSEEIKPCHGAELGRVAMQVQETALYYKNQVFLFILKEF